MAETRSKKGSVTVSVDRGWLRLRWSHQGKKYTMALGFPDNKANRRYAEGQARIIELDIQSNHFDTTLKKYRPEVAAAISQLTSADLFREWTEYKAKSMHPRTLQKYRAIANHLDEVLDGKLACYVGLDLVEKMYDYLKGQLSPRSLREYLELLSACWQWGNKQGYVEGDPWKEQVKRFKVPPKQPPRPFNREEIGAIIQGFRSDRYYHPYADMVEFMFATGCRVGEAIGLRWKHLADDCSSVWIGESFSRGYRKATKTNKARVVTLTAKLQSLLLARKPAKPDPDSLVFPAPKGGPVNDNSFRRRAWVTVLASLRIDYRPPYNTRHTLVSHALDLGMNPLMVAQLTGHDVEVLFRRYAGNVNSRPRLPEL